MSGSLPLLGHTVEFMRDPVALLERGWREHGKIFSLQVAGRPAVVLLGSEHSRFVFSETDKKFSIRQAYPFLSQMFSPSFGFLAEFEEYQRQRKLLLPRFQGHHLDAYLDIMERETREFIGQLGDQGEFDIVAALGPLVMRIAAHAFLGREFSARLGEGYFEEFRRFSAGMDSVTPPWLPLPHLVRSRRSRARLHEALGSIIRERTQHPVDPPDFLQTLAEARFADGSPVPDLLQVNMVLGLSWVGQETTAGQLSWALIDLLRHPHELRRLLDEQRDLVDSDEPLTHGRVHQLTHLDRALHETERVHPIAAITPRVAVETVDYEGYRIPSGCWVYLSAAVSHRLPEIFPDPGRFNPDRFLDDPRSTNALIGFGGGLHRCLGVNFAYLEMKVVLTRLLQRFDFELVDHDPKPVRGPKTRWPASPCRVRYRKRVPSIV